MMALAIAGAAVTAIGQVSSLASQAAAADFNKKVEERNARLVTEQTSQEVEDMRLHNRRVLGSMRAAFGANGFEMSGSPLDIMGDTIGEQEYDVAKRKFQGKLKATGHKEQAQLYGLEKSSAQKAMPIAVASSLLGGVSGYMNAQPAGSTLL